MSRTMSNMFRKFEKNCSSFRKADSLPCSKSDLNPMEDAECKTPERCLSPQNYKWKSAVNVVKVKRGKSTTNIDQSEPSENILNLREQYDAFNNPPNPSKFTKQYLKMKLAKILRSNSKLNDSSKSKEAKEKSKQVCESCNSLKSQVALLNEGISGDGGSNDALRNLSFTAAMMTKSSHILNNSPSDKNETIDHTTLIPSSTLRFWSKPSEEKLKASHRRNQQNIHGSSDVLLRINPSMDSNKHPSELSLFYDDGNSQPDIIRISNSDLRASLVIPYDKAGNRYQNIISQSKRVSRKKKALSLAYETETNVGSNRVEMRASHSSTNMSNLSRSNSVIQSLYPDLKRSFIYDDSHSPPLRGKSLNKDITIKPTMSPPPYSNNPTVNKRFVKPKLYSSRPSLSRADNDSSVKSRNSEAISHQRPPKPPPRGDSLIRSFELICKNLTTSISEPRGDSFKIFKSQSDYENWLKNLPYNNPGEIASLLRMRSKIARRKCVSELIDFHMVSMDDEKRRRHSWPVLVSPNITLDATEADRRTSSLPRGVNKKRDILGTSKIVDSPSLCNYSRLYSLRHTDPVRASTLAQADVQTHKSPPSSAVRNRRPFRYRYKQHNNSFNTIMTESCHESGSNSVI